jgi:hypothetical protein
MLSIVGNEDRQKRFNEHIKSSELYRRTDILEELLKLRNKAIRRQYQFNKSKLNSEENNWSVDQVLHNLSSTTIAKNSY